MVDPSIDLSADQAASHAALVAKDPDLRCVLVCLPSPHLEWVSHAQLHKDPSQPSTDDAAYWSAAPKEAVRAAVCNFQLRQLSCDLWGLADLLSMDCFCPAAQNTSYWAALHDSMYTVSSYGDMVALLKTFLSIFRPSFRLTAAAAVWTAEADGLLAMPHITHRQVAGLYRKLRLGHECKTMWPGQVVKWEPARIAHHTCPMDTSETALWARLKDQMEDTERPLLLTANAAISPSSPLATAPAQPTDELNRTKRHGRMVAAFAPPSPWPAAHERCLSEAQTAADLAVKALQLNLGLHVLCADLSQMYGDPEATPIPVLALDPNHPLPTKFRYITCRDGVDAVAPDKDWRAASSGCQCSRGAPCGAGCFHVRYRDAVFKHDKDWDDIRLAGRLSYLPGSHGMCILHSQANSHVHECGELCACSADCPMRVLQYGVQRKLALMPTSRGWGVFAAETIFRGQFVGEYTGIVIHDQKAEACAATADDEYLFDIFHRSWGAGNRNNCLVVDAHKAGNVTRFLNHSCLPNCIVRLVQWESDDPRLSHLAFYALKEISAGMELTIDYGYEVDGALPKEQKVRCMCGSGKKCKKWLRNKPLI